MYNMLRLDILINTGNSTKLFLPNNIEKNNDLIFTNGYIVNTNN